MARSISVLHVDDDPDFAALVSSYLRREDGRFNVRTATAPTDALELLSQHGVDCIVSDYDMPGQNGIQFLETVRETHPELPFILYTGKGSEEIASEAISAGVTDYLQKQSGTSQYTVLANRILNSVEKYRAQTELADREQRLNLFFEQSPLGVIRWDDGFNFARLNETAREILGYPHDELLGQPWEVVVPEENREEIGQEVVEDLLANEGGYHSINENVRKNGERIVCEWHNWVVTDETDDVVAVFSQFRDITERKAQREELERHRAIIEAANTAIISIDETNTVLSANPAVEATFGYAPDDIVGEDLTLLMPADVAGRHRAAFDRFLDTGERTVDWTGVEFTGQHRDGSSVPLLVSLAEGSVEDGRFFVGMMRDISEQKERQRELTKARQRFQTIFEASNDAIFLLDPEAERIVDANPQAESLLGYSKEELRTSVELSDIHPNDIDQYREFLDLVHANGLGRRGDFQCVTKDGEAKDCEISVSASEFDEDRYIVATVRDISERKDYEQRLEQFASTVSHELRNPLSIAEGRLELAREDCDSEHLHAVETAHDRMKALIEELLNLARDGVSYLDIKPIDLSTTVEGCWESVTTDRARLHATVDGTVLADESRLRQVFENLFRNAIEHGGSGVTVTVGELDGGFFVEDDGPGIAPGDRETVFDPGYSTSDSGTGLGLSIVKEAAEAHEWEIRVTEGSEGGARFEITDVTFAAR